MGIWGGQIAQTRPMAKNGNLGASFSVKFGEKTETKMEKNINFRIFDFGKIMNWNSLRVSTSPVLNERSRWKCLIWLWKLWNRNNVFQWKPRFFVNTFWRKRLHSLKTRHQALSEGAVPTQQQWNRPQIYLEVQISATHKFDTWAICAVQRVRNLSSEIESEDVSLAIQCSTLPVCTMSTLNLCSFFKIPLSVFQNLISKFQTENLKSVTSKVRKWECCEVSRKLAIQLSTRDKMGIR